MKKVILLSMLISVSLLTACNPKKTSSGRTAQTRTADASATISGNFSQSYCGQNVSPYGSIYDSGSSQSLYTNGSFEDRVKALLSATVNPSEVGQISSSPNDQTGVRFQGSIKIDSNGNVNLQQTKILIKVYDSYVLQSAQDGTNQYQPIPIEFTQAAEGHFNTQTGVGYVIFRDQYGDIRFDGNLSADFLSGTVSFSNNVNVNGGAGASGQLGQFIVARCGIIK